MGGGEPVVPIGVQRERFVLVVVLAMVLIVAMAALVVTYVAFPARGRQVPGAPWLGDALAQGADRLGLDEHEDNERPRVDSTS
jgi:hypothetical protein